MVEARRRNPEMKPLERVIKICILFQVKRLLPKVTEIISELEDRQKKSKENSETVKQEISQVRCPCWSALDRNVLFCFLY